MAKKKLKKKTKYSWGRLAFFGIFVAVVLGIATGFTLAEHDGYGIGNTEIPKLEVSLRDTTLEEINAGSKQTKYAVDEVKLVSGDEEVSLGEAEIKGRGNTSWGQAKKPYQIKLKQKAELLGLGERKKWLVIANFLDDTRGLRNDFAYKLAELIGSDYASTGEFVELYVDGSYEGLYYLVRKIEIGKNSVDLRGEKAVVVEVDLIHNEDDEVYTTDAGTMLVFKDAVSMDNEEKYAEAREQFMARFNELEKAASEGDYARVKEIVDVDSLAKYYLVNEFAVNPDAYSSSYYFYTEGDDDKIHAGPVWDFDYALGNEKWAWKNVEGFNSPEETMIRRKNLSDDDMISLMVYDLMNIHEFRMDVARIYRENLFGHEDELLSYFDEKAKSIRTSAETDRAVFWNDSEKNYITAVAELRDWIQRRLNYFRQIYGTYGTYGDFENFEVLKNES